MSSINCPLNDINKLREAHEIYSNGTVAYFKTDPQTTGRIPHFKTVHEELANNYLLRKIMTNSKRKIFLIDENSSDSRRLRYKLPDGKEILSEDFTIKYRSYKEFPVHISINRAERELTQLGDDRIGGLLVIDDENVVLGISLFKFDNEPLASRFFGEVVIGNFRELLENEEAVLDEGRDGLLQRHPFCQKIISKIEDYIELKVKEEKAKKLKEEMSKMDIEETGRYKKAFSILNKIAEEEAQEIINLGETISDEELDPPNGFCLYPNSANITVGKRYAFELQIKKKLARRFSEINITCNNQKISVLNPNIELTIENKSRIIRKHITVEGKEPNINGIIKAKMGNYISESKVYIIPEKELLFNEGMDFQPSSITLRPNKPKRVYLLVYVKIIEGGNKIRISSDNDSIIISKQEIIVNEVDTIKNIAKYELEIWGEGEGQNALITAEFERYIALLDVKVRAKEETEKDRKGMFNKPEFNIDPEPLQRTSYSSETGKVIIYANFPSIKHYIGKDAKYKKTLSSQVLLADLVAERCFLEISKKKVESSKAIIRVEAKYDKIQSDAFKLSLKYGKRLHEVLVDQKLLNENKKVLY